MLGLGWTEMLVIGVVALIFIGPKDLPVVMGRIGKVIGQVQRMGRDFQREINRTTGLDEVRNLRTSITSPLKKTADEIRKEFNSIGTDGQAKPSGVLKPTDPNTESVVEAIEQQAGMAPARKSSTELATEYGFGANKSEPVKAERKSTKPPTYADTETAKAAAAKAEAEKAAAAKAESAKPKKAAAKKAVAAAPAKAARPATANAAATKSGAAKPARKPPAIKAVSSPAPAAEAAKPASKPAAKPRAPRKKPAETAGKSE
ncbi:Sec-independent protein translocase protein TatB [Devosia sp. CAU 1758]